jgi:hypothetical protein
LGAISFYLPRDEPDEPDEDDGADREEDPEEDPEDDAEGREEDEEEEEEEEDGADIVLRLSTPRTLDERASAELSEPPNAPPLDTPPLDAPPPDEPLIKTPPPDVRPPDAPLIKMPPPDAPPPDVRPPDTPLTSGAGRDTVAGALMPLERFSQVGDVVPTRVPREESGTTATLTPGRSPRNAGAARLTLNGAGATGAVKRAARNVSAANPRSVLRAVTPVGREGPCQTATPRGATRLPGGWVHQLAGRGCPGPQANRWWLRQSQSWVSHSPMGKPTPKEQ